MAAVPSWQDDTAKGQKGRGTYDIGVAFGAGGVTGQASVQIEDFLLSLKRKDGFGRFRGGNDFLSLAVQSAGKVFDCKGVYEKRSKWGATGIAIHHSKLAPRQLAHDGYPHWSFRNRTATESRVYLVPKKSFLEELFIRVRKWDRETRATLFEHDLLQLDIPHVALGAKMQLLRTPSSRISTVIETGITAPYLRGELDAFGVLRKPGKDSPWIELRGSIKHLHPKGGLSSSCQLPPSGELYIAGGTETVKGLKEGGMLPEASHSSFLLPATTVASASVSRLAPLDETLGLMLFVDSAVASGPGNPSPDSLIPLTSNYSTWSTQPVLSCGAGLYLRAAPQIRAGIAAPLDAALRSSRSRQQFFITAAGDL
eukprot:TRINITY_DN232_c1_g1_i4.p1 TRINITY_DN232_c1_g1~~TRINITY_DN232_c1_g1_i4.p1  ORF type:complete len:384 (+),score=55.53 TRINITY_DN232_c1_g1_i4:47-1153(+)